VIQNEYNECSFLAVTSSWVDMKKLNWEIPFQTYNKTSDVKNSRQ